LDGGGGGGRFSLRGLDCLAELNLYPIVIIKLETLEVLIEGSTYAIVGS
jgi:hypothetical protein